MKLLVTVPSMNWSTEDNRISMQSVNYRKQTSLDQGQTDRLSLAVDSDLDLQSEASWGHDPYASKRSQGQRSVGSKDRVATNGQTDRRTDRRRRSHYLPR